MGCIVRESKTAAGAEIYERSAGTSREVVGEKESTADGNTSIEKSENKLVRAGEWSDLTELASLLLIVEGEMTARGRAIRALVGRGMGPLLSWILVRLSA